MPPDAVRRSTTLMIDAVRAAPARPRGRRRAGARPGARRSRPAVHRRERRAASRARRPRRLPRCPTPTAITSRRCGNSCQVALVPGHHAVVGIPQQESLVHRRQRFLEDDLLGGGRLVVAAFRARRLCAPAPRRPADDDEGAPIVIGHQNRLARVGALRRGFGDRRRDQYRAVDGGPGRRKCRRTAQAAADPARRPACGAGRRPAAAAGRAASRWPARWPATRLRRSPSRSTCLRSRPLAQRSSSATKPEPSQQRAAAGPLEGQRPREMDHLLAGAEIGGRGTDRQLRRRLRSSARRRTLAATTNRAAASIPGLTRRRRRRCRESTGRGPASAGRSARAASLSPWRGSTAPRASMNRPGIVASPASVRSNAMKLRLSEDSAPRASNRPLPRGASCFAGRVACSSRPTTRRRTGEKRPTSSQRPAMRGKIVSSGVGDGLDAGHRTATCCSRPRRTADPQRCTQRGSTVETGSRASA